MHLIASKYTLYSIDLFIYRIYIFIKKVKGVQGKMEEKLERIVYTVTETAEILGISRPTAFQGVKNGEIPCIRVGRRVLVPKAALEKLLATAGSKP